VLVEAVLVKSHYLSGNWIDENNSSVSRNLSD